MWCWCCCNIGGCCCNILGLCCYNILRLCCHNILGLGSNVLGLGSNVLGLCCNHIMGLGGNDLQQKVARGKVALLVNAPCGIWSPDSGRGKICAKCLIGVRSVLATQLHVIAVHCGHCICTLYTEATRISPKDELLLAWPTDKLVVVLGLTCTGAGAGAAPLPLPLPQKRHSAFVAACRPRPASAPDTVCSSKGG